MGVNGLGLVITLYPLALRQSVTKLLRSQEIYIEKLVVSASLYFE